eukprot:CAMPEP_0176201500 /NCGR_PEP_ID=MMETSP0121_2-20121125/9597_1 /TAXON_ID=160619 /ORGANISM="Kryptoperidinium foliaceum, Strain CCMP 1326" /LENGTH=231 /DNA_ID=CAMNT_0017540377 /DNA_START=31 /DNA_END=723 /DNA_ORIENTATION=-
MAIAWHKARATWRRASDAAARRAATPSRREHLQDLLMRVTLREPLRELQGRQPPGVLLRAVRPRPEQQGHDVCVVRPHGHVQGVRQAAAESHHSATPRRVDAAEARGRQKATQLPDPLSLLRLVDLLAALDLRQLDLRVGAAQVGVAAGLLADGLEGRHHEVLRPRRDAPAQPGGVVEVLPGLERGHGGDTLKVQGVLDRRLAASEGEHRASSGLGRSRAAVAAKSPENGA